jgi:hypothetical protein
MKVGLQVLCYNVTPFIVPMLDNAGPHVDRIYLAYSELPYSDYNPEARTKYRNPTPLSLIQESKYFDKIRVIVGDWPNETEQRNECVVAAREEGMDIMLVQDADEFFYAEDYSRNIKAIMAAPHVAAWSVPWYLFWKNTDYVIRHHDGSLIEYSACYALNLNHKDACFERRRMSSPRPQGQLPGIAFHLAYVYDNAGMKQKLETWSHSGDSDRENWYRLKWLTWTESTRYIHPFMPCYYARAERFSGELPPEVSRVPMPRADVRPKTFGEQIHDFTRDKKSLARHCFRAVRSRLSARFFAD